MATGSAAQRVFTCRELVVMIFDQILQADIDYDDATCEIVKSCVAAPPGCHHAPPFSHNLFKLQYVNKVTYFMVHDRAQFRQALYLEASAPAVKCVTRPNTMMPFYRLFWNTVNGNKQTAAPLINPLLEKHYPNWTINASMNVNWTYNAGSVTINMKKLPTIAAIKYPNASHRKMLIVQPPVVCVYLIDWYGNGYLLQNNKGITMGNILDAISNHYFTGLVKLGRALT